MLDSVKSDYVKAKVDQAGNDRLFKPVDRLFTSGSPVLPTIYDSQDSLSEILMTFMYKGFGTSGMSYREFLRITLYLWLMTLLDVLTYFRSSRSLFVIRLNK